MNLNFGLISIETVYKELYCTIRYGTILYETICLRAIKSWHNGQLSLCARHKNKKLRKK